MMKVINRCRASALIVQSGKVLVIQRVKPGLTYYVTPGGGIESGEDKETALQRELKEELGIVIHEWSHLFCLYDQSAPGYYGNKEDDYYLITKWSGEIVVGGPEKERMDVDNQYNPVWLPLDTLDTYDLRPAALKEEIDHALEEGFLNA